VAMASLVAVHGLEPFGDVGRMGRVPASKDGGRRLSTR
jgi:hypothetical protein